MEWCLENARFQMVVQATGAELTQLWDKQRQHHWLWQAQPGVWNNVATQLFPVVGQLIHQGLWQGERFYPLPAHGFLRNHPFACIEHSATRLVVEASDDRRTRAIWPFAWRLRIEWQLTDNGITLVWQVTNPGEDALGYSLGWHPGFALPVASQPGWHVRFAGERVRGPFRTHHRTLNTENAAPGVTSFPLTAQTFTAGAVYFAQTQHGQVAVCAPDGEAQILFFLHDQPWLALWNVPGEDFLCVEPLCGTTDAPDFDGQIAHKRGIRWLEAGKTCQHRLAVRFRADSQQGAD